MAVDNLLTFFPEPYTPSNQQTHLIAQIEKALKKHKFVICCAPTGSGKSLIAKTVSGGSSEPTKTFAKLVTSYEIFKQDFAGNYINDVDCLEEPSCGAFALTITKSLQDQYLSLFNKIDILKGKSNYTCSVDDNFTVELAPCIFAPKLKERCWGENKCPYYNARNNALLSPFAVLNYKMFLALPSHTKRKNMIICDEASELEEELVRQFSAEIDYSRLEQYNISVKKLISDNKQRARVWVYKLIELLTLEIENFLEQTAKAPQLITKSQKIRYQYLKNLHTSLSTIDSMWDKCEYIIDVSASKVYLTPLHADVLSQHIFNYGDKIVLMSATIIDHKHFAKQLGITDYAYIEAQSDFDASKSPIYVSSQYKLNYQNLKNTLPKICNQIKEIVDHHKDEKGIIHTHTQEITNIIQTKLGNDTRYLFRGLEATNEDILKQHYKTEKPTIIVSPSLMFGVDLKDDLARFQIIVKLPFLPFSSKRIKTLFKKDPDWYENKMLNAIVQASGRATRGKQDFSVTYILDGNFVNIVKKSRNKLPKHFIDRIH